MYIYKYWDKEKRRDYTFIPTSLFRDYSLIRGFYCISRSSSMYRALYYGKIETQTSYVYIYIWTRLISYGPYILQHRWQPRAENNPNSIHSFKAICITHQHYTTSRKQHKKEETKIEVKTLQQVSKKIPTS